MVFVKALWVKVYCTTSVYYCTCCIICGRAICCYCSITSHGHCVITPYLDIVITTAIDVNLTLFGY